MFKNQFWPLKRAALLNLASHNDKLLSFVSNGPNSIQLALTNRCNFRCLMCNYWRLQAEDELTTYEVKDILNQASCLGVRSCVLYGGEPMLRTDIFELTEHASNLGLDVSIISNGYLINDESAKKLSNAGLQSISISIDGTADIHDRIRGVRGAFDRALRAADLCRKQGVTVEIGALLMKPTLENGNIVRLINSLSQLQFATSIQLLDFSPFYFRDNPLKDKLWITESDQEQLEKTIIELISMKKKEPRVISNSILEMEQMLTYFRDPKRQDIPCYFVYMGRLWIDSRGRLYVCQSLPPIGDLRKQRLQAIITSSKYEKQLVQAFKKQCPGCSCSYSANISTHFPIRWKHFSNLFLRRERIVVDQTTSNATENSQQRA